MSKLTTGYLSANICGQNYHIIGERIGEAGLLYHYPQLIEKSRAKVAQTENTILLTEKEKIVTTA